MKRISLCCVLPLVLTVGVSAQVSSKRSVDVSVTDPLGRFVTNLEPSNFEVIENGARRAIAAFSQAGSPISIAVVSSEPLPAIPALGPQDEVIQAPSVADALRRLAASKNSRRAIMFLAPADTQAIPFGIQSVQTDREMLPKWVIELSYQYRIEFESSAPSASVDVVLKPVTGVGPLQLHWK
jgi:hypothetical protein